jgi:hypothetical protein
MQRYDKGGTSLRNDSMFEIKLTQKFDDTLYGTVLTGIVTGRDTAIRPCRCELFMDAHSVAILEYVDEVAMGDSPGGLRAIFTRQPVVLDEVALEAGQYRVVFLEFVTA